MVEAIALGLKLILRFIDMITKSNNTKLQRKKDLLKFIKQTSSDTYDSLKIRNDFKDLIEEIESNP